MLCFFLFKQKTAYEMRISDWSSDVCSSDLRAADHEFFQVAEERALAMHGIKAFGFGLGEMRHARSNDLESGALDARDNLADDILGNDIRLENREIGRASCRERVCQYV